jgi:hypothetical protein
MSPDGTSPPDPVIEQPARSAAENFADVVGYIDFIGGTRVSGWAWNRQDPEERLEVEVRLDNEPVTTERADRPRPDLEKARIGDGAYGFEVRLAEPLAKEEKHRVSAVVHKPGHGGVIRLKNQAAVSTEPLALRPSDFTALVQQLEQCVSDQRAGFRWIYHELQVLDEFVRGEARAMPAIEAPPAATAALDLADEFCAIESRFGEVLQAQASIRETLDSIVALQQSLNRRLEQVEVFQARMDTTLAELRQARAVETDVAADQPGLKRLVIFLGCLTLASLATGVVALFV